MNLVSLLVIVVVLSLVLWLVRTYLPEPARMIVTVVIVLVVVVALLKVTGLFGSSLRIR